MFNEENYVQHQRNNHLHVYFFSLSIFVQKLLNDLVLKNKFQSKLKLAIDDILSFLRILEKLTFFSLTAYLFNLVIFFH